MITTYRFRIKDSSCKNKLKRMARSVNLVWNFSNEIVRANWQKSRKYTNEKELSLLTAGSCDLLGINSRTLQATYETLLKKIKIHKYIKYRSKKSLGWIPLKYLGVSIKNGKVKYNKVKYNIWQDRDLPKSTKIKHGSFSEDSRGRWYVNLVCEVSDEDYFREQAKKDTKVGIDPGIKTILSLSDGIKYERDNITNLFAKALANAQKRNKKKNQKNLYAKMKNKRLDFNHKASETVAKSYEIVFFGDIKTGNITKSNRAKSVNDATLYQIKTFIAYKAIRRHGRMLVTNERNSTVTCSVCLTKTGPSGLSGLSIREWTCSNCHCSHDRDTNAAKNILRIGQDTLSLGVKPKQGKSKKLGGCHGL